MNAFLIHAEQRWAALNAGRQLGGLALIVLGIVAGMLELIG